MVGIRPWTVVVVGMLVGWLLTVRTVSSPVSSLFLLKTALANTSGSGESVSLGSGCWSVSANI
jgi:hypothetical protein